MFPVTFSVFVFNFEDVTEFISLLEPKTALHVVFVLQTRLSKVLTQASAVHWDVDTNRLWRSSVNSAGSWQWFHFLLPALHLSPDPPLRGALSLCALCVRGSDEYRQKFMYNSWLLQKKLQFSWLKILSMWEKYLHFFMGTVKISIVQYLLPSGQLLGQTAGRPAIFRATFCLRRAIYRAYVKCNRGCLGATIVSAFN